MVSPIRTDEGLVNRDAVQGSFTSYADAQRMAAEIVAIHGIPRRSLVIRPGGLRMARRGIVRSAKEGIGAWIIVGTMVGGFIGVAFGLVNATSGVIGRPWVVFTTLTVIGVTVGAMAGVVAGTLAARHPARLAEDPLDQASRYTVIVDVTESENKT